MYCSPSAILRMVPRRILPERVLGSRFTTHGLLVAGDGADRVPHHLGELFPDLFAVAVRARLEHHEPEGQLALELVVHADDRALGDVLVRGDDLFHLARGEPVAGDVDHVVHAAHDVDVAVLVDVPAVAREVVAGEGLEIGFEEPLRRPARAWAGFREAAEA